MLQLQVEVRHASHCLLKFPDCAHDLWRAPCERGVEKGSAENSPPSEKNIEGLVLFPSGGLTIAY